MFIIKFLYKINKFLKNIDLLFYSSQLSYLGKNVVIKSEVMFINPSFISIGEYSMIGERCYLRGGGNITIGRYCQMASNVIIVTTNHLLDSDLYYGNVENRDVIIGDNVWIGSGAKIMPGVSIGDNSVIGAGAVVTKNVDSNVLVAGVPAKVIKKLRIGN